MRWILIYLAERLARDPALRFASALRSTPLDDAADVVGRETSPSIKLVRASQEALPLPRGDGRRARTLIISAAGCSRIAIVQASKTARRCTRPQSL